MKQASNCVMNAMIMAVLLNLFLPWVLTELATPEEVNPPSGAAGLPLKSQFMHMMVHHKQVPLTISFIVALVTGLAVYLGYRFNPMKYVSSLKM